MAKIILDEVDMFHEFTDDELNAALNAYVTTVIDAGETPEATIKAEEYRIAVEGDEFDDFDAASALIDEYLCDIHADGMTAAMRALYSNWKRRPGMPAIFHFKVVD